ncbi:pyruvate kinase [Orbaceae bacterium ac157xtp]
MKKTKIICTIGPCSESKETLKHLLLSGMNAMRLNLSHGTHSEHAVRIMNLRSAMAETGINTAIILDTKGPEIRTMKLTDGRNVSLLAGQNFVFTTDQTIIGNEERVAVTYPNLTKDLKVKDRILVDDGLIAFEVIDIHEQNVICTVLNHGILGENKGINLPNTNIQLPILSDKDAQDLIWGCKQGVDFIAASFVRQKSDIETIRTLLDQNGGENIQIIAKIENQQGIDNFDEILEVANGIMIARGDLGVEIAIEDVILAQKEMIAKCNSVGKLVITATQMLESMTQNPRPTRAEAGDVANAILDGTDAVMLSGETAKGKYPIETTQMMSAICKRTDSVTVKNQTYQSHHCSIKQAIAYSAVNLATRLSAKMIIVLTHNGKIINALRSHNPTVPILALTDNEKILPQLLLIKDVIPTKIDTPTSQEDFYRIGKTLAQQYDYVNTKDSVVIISNQIASDNKQIRMISVQII